MKMIGISLALIASLLPVSSAIAHSLDWHAVKRLTTFTGIRVTTSQGQTACSFVRATEDQLCCTTKGNRMPSSNGGDVDLVFERQEIRAITVQTYDYSKGFLAFLGGFGGGAGLDSAGKPAWFGGVKIGGPISLDLQYDRLQGHSGFSVEGAAVLPLFRVPPFDPRRKKASSSSSANPQWATAQVEDPLARMPAQRSSQFGSPTGGPTACGPTSSMNIDSRSPRRRMATTGWRSALWRSSANTADSISSTPHSPSKPLFHNCAAPNGRVGDRRHGPDRRVRSTN